MSKAKESKNVEEPLAAPDLPPEEAEALGPVAAKMKGMVAKKSKAKAPVAPDPAKQADQPGQPPAPGPDGDAAADKTEAAEEGAAAEKPSDKKIDDGATNADDNAPDGAEDATKEATAGERIAEVKQEADSAAAESGGDKEGGPDDNIEGGVTKTQSTARKAEVPDAAREAGVAGAEGDGVMDADAVSADSEQDDRGQVQGTTSHRSEASGPKYKTSELTPMPLIDRLRAFMARYAPERLPSVALVAENNKDRENELMEELVQRFGPEPDGPEAAGIAYNDPVLIRVQRWFVRYQPHRVASVPLIISRFRNRLDDLFANLEFTLGPEPSGNGDEPVPTSALMGRLGGASAFELDPPRGIPFVHSRPKAVAMTTDHPTGLATLRFPFAHPASPEARDRFEPADQSVVALMPSLSFAATLWSGFVAYYDFTPTNAHGKTPTITVKVGILTHSHLYIGTEFHYERCIPVQAIKHVFLRGKLRNNSEHLRVLAIIRPSAPEHDCCIEFTEEMEAVKVFALIMRLQLDADPYAKLPMSPFETFFDAIDASAPAPKKEQEEHPPASEDSAHGLNADSSSVESAPPLNASKTACAMAMTQGFNLVPPPGYAPRYVPPLPLQPEYEPLLGRYRRRLIGVFEVYARSKLENVDRILYMFPHEESTMVAKVERALCPKAGVVPGDDLLILNTSSAQNNLRSLALAPSPSGLDAFGPFPAGADSDDILATLPWARAAPSGSKGDPNQTSTTVISGTATNSPAAVFPFYKKPQPLKVVNEAAALNMQLYESLMEPAPPPCTDRRQGGVARPEALASPYAKYAVRCADTSDSPPSSVPHGVPSSSFLTGASVAGGARADLASVSTLAELLRFYGFSLQMYDRARVEGNLYTSFTLDSGNADQISTINRLVQRAGRDERTFLGLIAERRDGLRRPLFASAHGSTSFTNSGDISPAPNVSRINDISGLRATPGTEPRPYDAVGVRPRATTVSASTSFNGSSIEGSTANHVVMKEPLNTPPSVMPSADPPFRFRTPGPPPHAPGYSPGGAVEIGPTHQLWQYL